MSRNFQLRWTAEIEEARAIALAYSMKKRVSFSAIMKGSLARWAYDEGRKAVTEEEVEAALALIRGESAQDGDEASGGEGDIIELLANLKRRKREPNPRSESPSDESDSPADADFVRGMLQTSETSGGQPEKSVKISGSR